MVCSLLDQTPVYLRRNESSNELYIDDVTPVDSKNATRRLQSWVTPAISLESRRLQQVAAVVRLCQCGLGVNNPVYCELKYDVCEPTRSGDMVCGKAALKGFAGILSPFILFWFIFLAFMVFFTPRGRFALAYIERLVCRVTAADQVTRMLRDRPDRARIMLRDYQIRLNVAEAIRTASEEVREEEVAATGANGDADTPTLESGLAPGQQYLMLRTKVYTTSRTPLTSQLDGEQLCSICLGTLQDGMRIGSLSCNHEFHVDCLKTWLKRKNHCPLCNDRVAELRVSVNETTAPIDADP